MRLWHSKLIPLLDNPRLSDLHMSCCNLRGLGWGKRNRNINYIYDDPLGEEALVVYHMLVLKEMERREYNFDRKWIEANYCGKRRQARVCDYAKFKKACWRNVPLKGHTLRFFVNDIKTLQERGLDITMHHYSDIDDEGTYTTYIVSRGDKTIYYGIRTKGGNNYE